VRASRALLKSVQLKKKITAPEYLLAYDLEVEKTRNELYNVLTIEDTSTGDRKSLPPAFFYGISDWVSCKTLDEAAIKASDGAVAYSINIDEVPPQSKLLPIYARSVIAVFNFIEYPKDCDDPLEDVKEWEDNWKLAHGIDQGARRYVAHTKQKYVIEGKPHERTSES